jgi:3-methyladenine DNA glycosylase AlkD
VPQDANAIVTELETELRAVGTPERAASEKAYLKSDLEFLGATVWQTRTVVKASAAATSLDHDSLLRAVEGLWSAPIFERRMAAVMLLELHPKLLTADDLPVIEGLIRDSLTWALVDGLAGDVVATIRTSDPSVELVLDRWSTDPDFWVRRSSLLAELRAVKGGADLGPFLRRADAMLEEKEFFIRKAIGWVLREVAKKRPDEVSEWLAPRTGRVSGVTIREAVRYLPDPDKARLMEAYRRHLPAT